LVSEPKRLSKFKLLLHAALINAVLFAPAPMPVPVPATDVETLHQSWATPLTFSHSKYLQVGVHAEPGDANGVVAT